MDRCNRRCHLRKNIPYENTCIYDKRIPRFLLHFQGLASEGDAAPTDYHLDDKDDERCV